MLSALEGLRTLTSCQLTLVKPSVYALRICQQKECGARVGAHAAAGAASLLVAASLVTVDLHIFEQCGTCVGATVSQGRYRWPKVWLLGVPGRAGGANAGAGRIEAAEDEIAFEGAMVVTPADATLVRCTQAYSGVSWCRV